MPQQKLLESFCKDLKKKVRFLYKIYRYLYLLGVIVEKIVKQLDTDCEGECIVIMSLLLDTIL